MINRKKFLTNIIEKAKKGISALPDGHLYVVQVKGKSYYYCSSNKKTNYGKKSYLHLTSPQELKLLKELATKKYLQQLKEDAEKEIKALTLIDESQNYPRIEDTYSNLKPSIKQLVTPIIQSDDEYARAWEKADFVQKPKDDKHIYETEKGDWVQSKGELIIANLLYSLNIPYRYECALKIDDNITLHPDFTILKKSTREVFYHEHCGLMDQFSYVDSLAWRVEQYAKLGIYNGNGLSLSLESNRHGINTNVLRQQFITLYQ